MTGAPRPGTSVMPPDFEDLAPTWEELESMLRAKQTPEEREADAERERGYGPASSAASLRLFDAPPGTEPRVVLYRDSAAWCPYCFTVWLQLEEKRIPYCVKKVPLRCYGEKPLWFRQLMPSGMLPVAEIDGEIIRAGSDAIRRTLEERFPENNPLLPPPGSPKAAQVGPLMQLERKLFSAWFGWLTSGGADARQRENFVATMDRTDAALAANGGGGPYFLGKELSLVDVVFSPFLERMAASLPYYKALPVRGNTRWPAVQRWFDAMEARPTYGNIRSDFYTHVHDLPPQVGGCVSVNEAVPFADEIDGATGLWSLPVREGIEPLGATPPEDAARQAATRVIGNRDALVRFVLRGTGLSGDPPVAAPLADPHAVPDEGLRPAADAALRHVVYALLEGPAAAAARGLSRRPPAEPLARCLRYLQLRVGVPRDLSFESAQQLRAHLGWYMGELAKQTST